MSLVDDILELGNKKREAIVEAIMAMGVDIPYNAKYSEIPPYIWNITPPFPKFYAEGTSGGAIFIRKDNSTGLSLATIWKNEWDRIRPYIPFITTIGSYFCYSWTGNPTYRMDFNELTTCADDFMAYCNSFNQPITFPVLTSCGARFMYGNRSFNQPIDFPMLQSCGDYFWGDLTGFNQSLDFVELTSCGNASFMFLSNMQGTIRFRKKLITPPKNWDTSSFSYPASTERDIIINPAETISGPVWKGKQFKTITKL
jgi:hypothetical protein